MPDKGIGFKRALLTYGAADLLSKSIGLITSPITTRLLTMEQYGVAPLLQAVWSPFALMQYGGMDWAYPFFYARKKSNKEGKQLIVSATFFAFISVLATWLIFILFSLYSDWLSKYASVTRWELIFFLFALLPTALIQWLCYLLRYLNRADSYVKISLFGRVLPVILILPILPFFELENRLLVSFSAGWIVSLLGFLYALYEVRRTGNWPFSLFHLNISQISEMFKYGILLVPAGCAYALMTVVDRLLIGYYLGTNAIALHTLAIALGSIGIMIVSWFGLAFDPILARWIATEKKSTYIPKMQLLANSMGILLGLLSVLASLWSFSVVKFLYPSGYIGVADIIPLIVFCATITAFSRIAVATAIIAQTAKFHNYIYWIALLFNVFFGATLIPVFGVIGAVFGTILAEFFILLCWVYLGKIYLRNLIINWSMPLFCLLLSFVIINIISTELIKNQNFFDMILNSTFTLLLYFTLLYIAIGRQGINQLYNFIKY